MTTTNNLEKVQSSIIDVIKDNISRRILDAGTAASISEILENIASSDKKDLSFLENDLNGFIVELFNLDLDDSVIIKKLEQLGEKLNLIKEFSKLQGIVNSISTSEASKSLQTSFKAKAVLKVNLIADYIKQSEADKIEADFSFIRLRALIKGLQAILTKCDSREISSVESYFNQISAQSSSDADFVTQLKKKTNEIVLVGYKEEIYDVLISEQKTLNGIGKKLNLPTWGLCKLDKEVKVVLAKFHNEVDTFAKITLLNQALANISEETSRYKNGSYIYGNTNASTQTKFNILLNASIEWIKAIGNIDFKDINETITEQYLLDYTQMLHGKVWGNIENFEEFFETQATTAKVEVVTSKEDDNTSFQSDFFEDDDFEDFEDFDDIDWNDIEADEEGDVVLGQTIYGDKIGQQTNMDFRGKNIGNFVNNAKRNTDDQGAKRGSESSKQAKNTVQNEDRTVYQYGTGQTYSGDKVKGKTSKDQEDTPKQYVKIMMNFQNAQVGSINLDCSNPYKVIKNKINVLTGEIGYLEGESDDLFEVQSPNVVKINTFNGGCLKVKTGARVEINIFNGGNIYVEPGSEYYIKIYNSYGDNIIHRS